MSLQLCKTFELMIKSSRLLLLGLHLAEIEEIEEFEAFEAFCIVSRRNSICMANRGKWQKSYK